MTQDIHQATATDAPAAASEQKPQRTYFATKAEWARNKAVEIRAEAHRLRFESSHGSARRAARKYEGIDRLLGEAARFDHMAARFERQGK